MGRTGWLVFLVGAPLLGTSLAIMDLVLGLHGAAVAVFVALCIAALFAIGAVALTSAGADSRQEDRPGAGVTTSR